MRISDWWPLAWLALCLAVGCATGEDFLPESLNRCASSSESWSGCLKREVLGYLDARLGTSTEIRALEGQGLLDEALVSRTFKYLRGFDYATSLPLLGARLRYSPSRGLADLDLELDGQDRQAGEEARGLLKKKLLLPMLLLLKLKLKALMPIFVAIIGLKAMKALVLSKLALIIVVGFVASQFLKKGGMMMPPMGMTMEPTPAYGAPPVSSTTSGYEPVNTWDGNGPYSRVWTASSGLEPQNLAYNYYSGSSSSNTYGGGSGSGSSSSSSASSSGSSSSSGHSSGSGNSSGPTYSHSRRK